MDNKNEYLEIIQSERFSKHIIDEMFSEKVTYRAALFACTTAIAKLLCHMVADGQMTEKEAEEEVDIIREWVILMARADRRPIFKETKIK